MKRLVYRLVDNFISLVLDTHKRLTVKPLIIEIQDLPDVEIDCPYFWN